MKIYFITFGCKVNSYETQSMKQAFESNGFTISADCKGCEVYIVNSCAVTETGVQKTLKAVRRLRRENPTAVIALTGCLPQSGKTDFEKIPEADIITGTKNRSELPELVKSYLSEQKKLYSIHEFTANDSFAPDAIAFYGENTRAFVKIQDGCNMFCSYCIIPYVRGGFRSKPLDDVVSEVKTLVSAGYREVVLTGINLSFYGTDLGLRLIDAVEAVCKVQGLDRVRLGSLEPKIITDEDIARLSVLEKLCPHFHLSLQSGCNQTLKAMNRKYNCEEYKQIVLKLRKAFKNCSVTTDIIVGFPGETEAHFAESLEFAREMRFSNIHIFPYSKREGTAAALMDNQIPSGVKKMRASVMAEIAGASRSEFLKSQIGLIVPVLFETEKEDGIAHGYSPNYTLIKMFTKNSLQNRIFYVKIVKAEKDDCIGEIVTVNC
ncbi:MAG: tRNA (N(6)-L-threonylcarbamoyladenosine(37)-C(2))-methylthiotransferase MtaB [Oscillospiraceae bacterium]|nr:tRNA (N(6)-L-threonylcarbamoyladenosine(37)-C(2))-methylthiotransferase MtaB [Oscillospiraceae bacterium]